MTKLSRKLDSIRSEIRSHHIRSVSFDIDGTVYPIRRVQLRWWKNVLRYPRLARRFYKIKLTWEGRRKGDQNVAVSPEDIRFFEAYLVNMLSPDLVPTEVKSFLRELRDQNLEIFFLSDHGAEDKLQKLNLTEFGTPINCLRETGELKPHRQIAELLREKYFKHPDTHLHMGDRWTDEEQALLIGCHFSYFICP